MAVGLASAQIICMYFCTSVTAVQQSHPLGLEMPTVHKLEVDYSYEKPRWYKF